MSLSEDSSLSEESWEKWERELLTDINSGVSASIKCIGEEQANGIGSGEGMTDREAPIAAIGLELTSDTEELVHCDTEEALDEAVM